MTIFEKIKSMDIDEMAKVIAGLGRNNRGSEELEAIETVYCGHLCPHHRGNNGCEFEEDHKCVVDNITMVKAWLELDYVEPRPIRRSEK